MGRSLKVSIHTLPLRLIITSVLTVGSWLMGADGISDYSGKVISSLLYCTVYGVLELDGMSG